MDLGIAVPSFAPDQERKDFTRWVKKQVTADSSATSSVRLAGTSNFKTKYIGNFPKVAIIDAVPAASRQPRRSKPLALLLLQNPPPPWFDSKLPVLTAARELIPPGRTMSFASRVRRLRKRAEAMIAAWRISSGA